jgi:hypothetical protein
MRIKLLALHRAGQPGSLSARPAPRGSRWPIEPWRDVLAAMERCQILPPGDKGVAHGVRRHCPERRCQPCRGGRSLVARRLSAVARSSTQARRFHGDARGCLLHRRETRLQREAGRRRLHRKNVQVLPGTEPVGPRTIARDALLRQVGVRDRRRPHEQAAETIQKKYGEGYALRPDTRHEVAELAGIRAETFVNTIDN